MSQLALDALPWAALLGDGEIDWEALERLADAVAADAAALEELIRRWHEAISDDLIEGFTWLLAAPVLVMASERCAAKQRDRIAAAVVEALMLVEDGDDYGAETIYATSDHLGPAMVPHALKALDTHDPQDFGVGIGLWAMLELASKSQDAALCQRVVNKCRAYLEEALAGAWHPTSPELAAWPLAKLGHTDSLPLLREVADAAHRRRTDRFDLTENEIRHAIRHLEGKGDPLDREQRPLREWVSDFYEATLRHERTDDYRDGDDDRKWPQVETPLMYDERVVSPIVNEAAKVGRNEPCSCGSGKKYKKCCGK